MCLEPQVVALIISLPGHFSIEILTGSEINEDLHDGVEISLGTLDGGLKVRENLLILGWCDPP